MDTELKIRKDIPIPPKHQFEPLLKMKIGDCVEFTNETSLNSAHTYLYKYKENSFNLRKRTISKEPYLARMWRVE